VINGKLNQINKIIHDGENSFIVHLQGKDNIYFELENYKNTVMINESSTLYIIKL
jgi:hypothetical protein